jgi:hypothetical protein
MNPDTQFFFTRMAITLRAKLRRVILVNKSKVGGWLAIEYTSLVHQIHAIATEKIGFPLQLAWENSPH